MVVVKIAKEKEKTEPKDVDKVHISIYKDEFETVQNELDIKEVTSRTVREALGLPLTHSKTGAKSKLIKQIRDMSKEEAEKALEESEDNE